jgi:HSP20 family protein
MDNLLGSFGRTYNSTHNKLPANISSQQDKYEISILIPGFTKDEIKLTVSGNTMLILAEKSTISDVEYFHKEFAIETVERKISLPSSVKKDAISASYNEGILTITLPHSNLRNESSIEIQVC